MCAIAGIIWSDPKRPAALSEVDTMCKVLYHRGPDDGGVYVDGAVALGHRRLSIIDLSMGGHQPMVSSDGSLIIVYNGEIYNFLELRRELEDAGRVFRSDSDTEVILHAYDYWGEACVSHFHGMWAFALFDRRKREILLSRDRFGIKPLYYYHDNEVFAFASEIKGLLAGFPRLRQVNHAMVYHFLPSGALDDGSETFFDNVYSLPAATNIRLDIGKFTIQTDVFWSLDRDAFRSRWCRSDPVETMRYLLRSSVAAHMRSDVPVGTCLSGGLDSSTLVATMQTLRDCPVYTFSGLYPDRGCDESFWVEAVERHTQCRGNHIRPQPDGDLLADLQSITWHQDEPTAGPGLYTQFHVMKRARADVKVILDGQGGDELFAGYLPYLALRANDLLAGSGRTRLSGYLLCAGIARHAGLAALSGIAESALLNRAVRAMKQARAVWSRIKVPEAEPPFFHPGLAARRAAGQPVIRQRDKQYPDTLSDTLYWHLVQQSIPALLHYEDRNSMAFSIEARVPYLDHRIVEFALGLDPAYKIRNSWTKWVLRKAVEPVLPNGVTWRRSKLGYPTPFARWLRQMPNSAQLYDVLFSRSFIERELMERRSLEFYWKQHQTGAADRSWLIYRCVTLELWHRQFIDELAPYSAVPMSSSVQPVTITGPQLASA
jgi:asparagine synthase (glutamine-hydrolysing)